MEPEQQNQPPAPESAPVTTVERNTLMAVLSYIGPLVIIPFLTAKEDGYVAFHIKQGLVLLSIEIALWVIGMMLWFFWPVIQIVNIGVLILAIIGIVNAVQGKEKEIPWVGSYAKHFKI